jgi:hypothetical protein
LVKAEIKPTQDGTHMLLLRIITNHKHYWGVPHPAADGRLIQTCYECGRDRSIRVELRPPDFHCNQTTEERRIDQVAA